MSLPPGFLDDLRSRTSLSQVVGRKVMWNARKSNQGKGDMWAPCPFHQEKTASFHVDDQKGFYYCFGCQAKGDAISFVRETENVDFMEAVEILAREAGLPLPAQDPQAQKKADRRSLLVAVMEQAVQFYRLQLKTGAGAGARDYLGRRGLTHVVLDRWEIGFAPDARQVLWMHLRGKNIAPELIIDAGLAARPDDGGSPYDRFRGRIIFPIRDGRGRAIALGGRSMAANARAKYLNSPETALFDKGRSLFNLGPARQAAGKGQPLVVAEGYMDVIALCEAGFGACVAPLGTAITEHQLHMMWRVAPEPIIALDGDTAGLRAAERLIELALPMLEAGQSLRFALLPGGQDPDDLIRARGAAAMQAVLAAAEPMVHLLWQRETRDKIFDSPERKAAFDKRLHSLIRTIKDPAVRGHYNTEIKRLCWDLFRPKRWDQGKRNWKSGAVSSRFGDQPARFGDQPMARSDTKASLLVAAGEGASDALREAVILATLLGTPAVLATFEGALERLEMSAPDRRAILTAILSTTGADDAAADDLRAKVERVVGAAPLEKLFAPRHVQIAPSVRTPGDVEIAALCLAEELAKLEAQRGAAHEIREAMEDMDGLVDEGVTWRLGQAAQARNRAERSDSKDKAVYDTGANGAQIMREEREAFEKILENITYIKGKPRAR